MNEINSSFSMNKALSIVAIGCGIAGFVIALGTVWSNPSSARAAWFLYPLGSLIYGLTVIYVFGKFLPTIRIKKKHVAIIAAGVIASVVLDLTIGRATYYALYAAQWPQFLSFIVWNFFWLIGFPITIGIVTEIFIIGFGIKALSYWLFVSIFTIVFYAVLPKFSINIHPYQVPAFIVAGIMGAVISGVIGCYLTLKNAQKDIQKLVEPARNSTDIWTKAGILGAVAIGCVSVVWAIFIYSSTQVPAPKHTSIAGLVHVQDSQFVGTWQLHQRARWVKITKAGQTFQCRIDKEGNVFRSEGVLIEGNQIVWQDLWDADTVHKGMMTITLDSNGTSIVYQIPDSLMDPVCEAPF